MKSYQRDAQFTPLSGISPALSYITHENKISIRAIKGITASFRSSPGYEVVRFARRVVCEVRRKEAERCAITFRLGASWLLSSAVWLAGL